MARSIEEVVARIDEATRAGFRGRLAARGLARNLIWSRGTLPPGSPDFHPRLSSDLVAYGLALFELGLQIRGQDRTHRITSMGSRSCDGGNGRGEGVRQRRYNR
jgi:hypothetical protein